MTPAAPELVQAVCVDGVVTEPTLTLADTDVITYSADPAGPYSQGQSVTVTATLARQGWRGRRRCRGVAEFVDTTADVRR